jgi:hypothetical protein
LRHLLAKKFKMMRRKMKTCKLFKHILIEMQRL